jgi:hypothetical protein
VATFAGAIALRVSSLDGFGKRFRSWEIAARKQTSDCVVQCPRCSEAYVLVEEIGAPDETVTDDLSFLTRGVASIHPHHSTYVLVRDPKGTLRRQFDQVRIERPAGIHRSRGARILPIARNSARV